MTAVKGVLFGLWIFVTIIPFGIAGIWGWIIFSLGGADTRAEAWMDRCWSIILWPVIRFGGYS